MPIRVQCSKCKTTLAVKDHLAGKRVKCPKCQAPLAVPAAKAPVAPAVNQAELEALAAAALGDEPAPAAASHGTNGAHGPPSAGRPPIKFNCEYCEAEIEIDAELGGKRAPCPECRQIIKVPVPKDDKPKNWRSVEKKGPSLAAVNQPAKIEDAWGTETKSKVSQTALLEAGVIAKPKAPSIGLAGWIERGVKAAAIFAVVGGVGWVVLSLHHQAEAQKKIAHLERACNAKWPAPIQCEFHILMADLALRQPKQRETAREHYIKAFQKLATADAHDKIDRDFSLIHLAKEQTKLGGDDLDVRGQDRYDWNDKVFEEIDRTVKMIDNPDARVSAVRELAFLFADVKKPELAISLANSISASTPQAKAICIAILSSDANPGKAAEANRVASPPDAGKGPVDFLTRCGYAEGMVRKDRAKFTDATVLALRPGSTADKFQALLAIASSLALDPANEKLENVNQACEMASELLKKEPRANIPAWVLLQHVRLTARVNAEEAKTLVPRLPSVFRRRAHLEIALAALEKVPPPANAQAIIHELDNEGPNRALAWHALAGSKTRAKLPFTFVPESPEEELLRPFFQAVEACPLVQAK